MDRRGDRTAEGIGGQQRMQEDSTLQESSDIKVHKHFVGYLMNLLVAERIKETN